VARLVFATHRDNQKELTLQVVEGESEATADNRTVGRFKVVNLPRRPAGEVEVEVIFEMNESGALSIIARDLVSGNRTTSEFQLET
jgi:molecular chaperone DnaK (HSP70)